MAVVDKADLKLGFWAGLGVILALIVWGFVSALLARARRAAGGG